MMVAIGEVDSSGSRNKIDAARWEYTKIVAHSLFPCLFTTMNLTTAKTIVKNWDKPLIRQIFWYLVIPAHVEIQQAEPLSYAYCNAQQIPYRLIYLVKFLLALGALALTTLIDGAPTLTLLLQLASGYLIAMYGVWALAYWSMKRPASQVE